MSTSISPERLETLQTYWVRLAANFGCVPIAAYPIFDQLVAAYSQPHRQYHTLEHIAEMLKVVGRLSSGVRETNVLMLAVWFHDVVYDPRSHDNEFASAILAEEWLEPFRLTSEQLQELRRLILLTDHRSRASHDAAAMALLDADLAILASGEARYARYSAAIRQEYAHVNEVEYRAGRAKVLRAFLDRDTIYLTSTMRLEAESAARQNLLKELQSLVDQ